MPAASLEDVVSLCKRRGFIFPGSDIYGGLANTWDFGPLGVEMCRNIKQQWWEALVYRRDDVEGIDAAIMMNRKTWKYSGHEDTFNDPMVDNKASKRRYRLDHLIEAQSESIVRRLEEEVGYGGGTADPEWAFHIAHIMMRNPEAVPEQMISAGVIDPHTGETGDWTAPRAFNLMFSTYFGATAEGDEDAKVYLRPETAQGIFVNFKQVLDTMRRKLPFGIAQQGKSFRNEITPGNFIFRTREFEQMEMEFFVPPPPYGDGDKTDDDWHAEWVTERYNWYIDLGLAEERTQKRAQTPEELAHYAKATTDIEYRFPGSLGFAELEGIANRTDFDLTAHSKEVPNDAEARERLKLEANPDSTESLTFYDQERKEHVVPYVIEPAAGVARPFLAFLCEAYAVEPTKEIAEPELKKVMEQVEAFVKSVNKNKELSDEQKANLTARGEAIVTAGGSALPEISSLLAIPGADQIALGKKLRGAAERIVDANFRTVLKLDPRLAPVKVAVFPLKRNHDEIVAKARETRLALQQHFRAVYDDTGAIGKLYRRQDEIGTPFCVTVDFDTLEDDTVTVRNRDTMEQERVKISELVEYLRPKLKA